MSENRYLSTLVQKDCIEDRNNVTQQAFIKQKYPTVAVQASVKEKFLTKFRPKAKSLNEQSVLTAYKRWAKVYDVGFGLVSSRARLKAVEAINNMKGERVLEMGVGTGLTLTRYKNKRVVGIDLTSEMLEHARKRVKKHDLTSVEALLEMNAEETSFADSSFDVVTAMFVASVVPNPTKLIAEMKRLVKPGGHILFVNHFAEEKGVRALAERMLAPASALIGWHPHFEMNQILSKEEQLRSYRKPVPPFGLFTLVDYRMPEVKV